MKKLLPGYLIPALLLSPGLAFAHAGETGGWLQGVMHPFTGADHLFAMIAVGLWAMQMGGRGVWLVPGTFVCAMVLGGLLGMAALPLPCVEGGILASLLVLGAFIFSAFRLPVLTSMALAGFFALFHGHAHGSEMPVNTSGLGYALGFIFSTAMLHLAGIAMAKLLSKTGVRLTGAVLFGGALCLFA